METNCTVILHGLFFMVADEYQLISCGLCTFLEDSELKKGSGIFKDFFLKWYVEKFLKRQKTS